MNNTISLYLADIESVSDQYQLVLDCTFDHLRYLNLPQPLLKIVHNQYGKPDFINDNIHFNLSHSANKWICAISQYLVGVDIEKKRECRKDLIAKRFFHFHESQFLKENDYQAFFDVWCAKESVVKCQGSGIFDDFSLFSVIDDHQIIDNFQGMSLYPLKIADLYAGYLCSQVPSTLRILEIPKEDLDQSIISVTK